MKISVGSDRHHVEVDGVGDGVGYREVLAAAQEVYLATVRDEPRQQLGFASQSAERRGEFNAKLREGQESVGFEVVA